MSFQDQFDVILVNDDLETTLEKAQKLTDNFLHENIIPEKATVV